MGRPKKYQVRLTDKEVKDLTAILTTGTHDAITRRRADILLHLDHNHGDVLSMEEIATQCRVTTPTIYTTSRRFAETGLTDAFLGRKPRTRSKSAKITGEIEAQVIAKACSEPPEGFSKWTVRLLADKIVLDNGEKLSHMSIQRILKKHH